MIKENRVSKYLLYAIGEIVLVMVGILLALQVNNWNEERKRNTQERKMLNELVVNLRLDSADHKTNIEFYEGVARAAEYVVRTIEDRSAWNDTMETHYGYLLRHGLATFNTSAYDNLRSIGFDLIRNDSIRIALTNLHMINYAQVLKFEQELAADNQTFLLAPIFLDHVRMDRPWYQGKPHDHAALLDDEKFLEAVRWKATTMDYVAHTYGVSLKKITALMEMIERELKARNQE